MNKTTVVKSFMGEIPPLFNKENPYSDYHKIRKETPLLRISPMRWLIMSYKDAVALFQNPSVSHWGQDPETQKYLFGNQSTMSKTMFAYAPEINSPYRKNVLHGLAAKNLQFEKIEMYNSAEKHLKKNIGKGYFDFIHDFVHPYTFETISRIIGIPSEDIPEFTEIISSLKNGYLQYIINQNPQEKEGQQFISFLEKFILDKKQNLGNDLASALITSCMNADEDDSFISSLLIFLMYAGHDNMMNFIGNSTDTLAKNKTTFEQLKSDINLVSPAIDEFLRYDSPVQFSMMFTKDEIFLRDKKIAAGSQLLVCIGAANRDPEQFQTPNKIILDRRPQHLSYGFGAYRCIGARLAQLQSAAALEAVINNVDSIKMNDRESIRKNDQYIQRGYQKLVLKLD